MSRMQLKTQFYGNFTMNVLAFSAPIYGSVSSVQTKTMQHHYPIRANQPNIQFSVIFPSHEEFERFQRFVIRTQKKALEATPSSDVGVRIWWPEREMDNWSGIIKEIELGGRKFDWAPRAKFSVELVDSWISRKTSMTSLGAAFETIFQDSPLTKLFLDFEDALLRLPSAIGSALQQQINQPAPNNGLGPIFGGGGGNF